MVVTTEGKSSVLIVDDNPLIRNVLQNILLHENFEVSVAANGISALSILEDRVCDVILCDVMMPEMDGYQLLTAVRSKKNLEMVPFVFLTGLDSEIETDKGLRSDCDAYLTKPFDPQKLIATLKGRVARSQNIKKVADDQRDHFRRRVLQTVSHEFRTPLVAVSTGSEMLMDQLKMGQEVDFKEAQKLLEAIYRGGQRLERLISDFMILQQIELGIAESFQARNSRLCKVSGSVQMAVDAMMSVANENQIELSIHGEMPGISVKVCETQLVESIKRLIDNGIKFSMSPNRVEVKVERTSTEVVISVIDSGPGFDPIKIQEAVGAFSQVDRDRLEQQGGGLGLAIADKLVVLNGGRLKFSLAEGTGGVVSIILPLYPFPKS